jgi:hypothetical protein
MVGTFFFLAIDCYLCNWYNSYEKIGGIPQMNYNDIDFSLYVLADKENSTIMLLSKIVEFLFGIYLLAQMFFVEEYNFSGLITIFYAFVIFIILDKLIVIHTIKFIKISKYKNSIEEYQFYLLSPQKTIYGEVIDEKPKAEEVSIDDINSAPEKVNPFKSNKKREIKLIRPNGEVITYNIFC